MLLAKHYSRYVPFADVNAMCKYVGDKVGNRPIAAIHAALSKGIREIYYAYVSLPSGCHYGQVR